MTSSSQTSLLPSIPWAAIFSHEATSAIGSQQKHGPHLVFVAAGHRVCLDFVSAVITDMTEEHVGDPSMLTLPRARQKPGMSNSRPVIVDVTCGPTLGLWRASLGQSTLSRYSSVCLFS